MTSHTTRLAAAASIATRLTAAAAVSIATRLTAARLVLTRLTPARLVATTALMASANLTLPAHADADAGFIVRPAPATTLRPDTREVAACGVRLDVVLADTTGGSTAPRLTATLRQRREGRATRTEWCVKVPQIPDSTGVGPTPRATSAPRIDREATPADVSLRVPGLATLTATVAPGGAGEEHCIVLSESTGLLFQRLFIGGGTLHLPRSLVEAASRPASEQADAERPEGAQGIGNRHDHGDAGNAVLALPLQRPLPVAISRAYLNCAGDLFRPEDEA